MAIVKRLDKGATLTYAELDGNFDHLTAEDAAVRSEFAAADALHAALTDNPHSVTATQVGLGNVDNTADLDKPVSTATQTAINEAVAVPQGDINDHIADTAGAHADSAITFTPAGTGAVASTVQAKLREVVSVKDFGALGDGSTDDTTAIQAAITACADKVLYFPKGVYLFTSLTIDSTNSIILQGEGNTVYPYDNATTLQCTKADGLTDVAITVATSRNGAVSIRDMNIVGGASSADYGYMDFPNNGVGIYANALNRFEMRNVTVAGFQKYGLQYYQSYYGRIDNCYFRYNAIGIYSDGSNTTLIIQTAFQYNNTGIRNPPTGVGMIGCTFEGNAYDAILLETTAGQNYSFTGCHFEQNNLSRITVGESHADIYSTAASTNICVKDCYFGSNYDGWPIRTNNIYGAFNKIIIEGMTRFFNCTDWHNIDGTTGDIFFAEPAYEAKTASSYANFINSASTGMRYASNANNQLTLVDPDTTITIPPDTLLIRLSSTVAKTVSTITMVNSSRPSLLVVKMANADITLQENTGNLRMAGNFTSVGTGGQTVTLMYSPADGAWYEVSRSAN